VTDDAGGLLAYERVLGDRRALVAFNVSDRPAELSLPAEGDYRAAYPAGAAVSASGGQLRATLPARAARVWIRP
jgi:hypothetical protein